ncbi:hypothetical protein BD413DRAFT_610196 [Trametes elegans]|nr:hypothetical protein BD413DRAFT_610196 [Trametes elegans]
MPQGSLNVTVGALLIGCLITAVGFGITTMQTYMYSTRFPKDPNYLRIIVGALFILDTAHVGLSWHAIYHYLITNFGNHNVLADSVWSFNVTIILTTVITVIVHCFFARRIWILSDGNWFLTVLIVVLSLVRLVFGCYVSIEIFILKNLSTLPFKLSPYVGTALGAGTLADFIVSGCLVYYLRRSRTGFRGTDNLVDRIISWTVNNGLLTSIVGMTVIITFSVMPDNMIFLGVHLLLSKRTSNPSTRIRLPTLTLRAAHTVYANSLLGTLNFRRAHAGRGMYDDPSTVGTLRLTRTGTHSRFPISRLRFSPGPADSTDGAHEREADARAIGLQLDTERSCADGGPVIALKMPGLDCCGDCGGGGGGGGGAGGPKTATDTTVSVPGVDDKVSVPGVDDKVAHTPSLRSTADSRKSFGGPGTDT